MSRPADLRQDATAIADTEVPTRDHLIRHGCCADLDPSVFFPPIDYAGERSGWNPEKARRICSGCPVRIPCLTYANDQPQITNTRGVWGGRSRKERRSIANAIRYRERTRAKSRSSENVF